MDAAPVESQVRMREGPVLGQGAFPVGPAESFIGANSPRLSVQYCTYCTVVEIMKPCSEKLQYCSTLTKDYTVFQPSFRVSGR